MRHRKHSIKKLPLFMKLSIVFTCLALFPHSALATEAEDDFWGDFGSELTEELNWLKAETFVISATQTLESIKQAAASVTVITGRDIENMGANHLGEVLNSVPGFGSAMNKLGLQVFQSRGLVTARNQRLLFLLNSQPLNRYSHDGGVSYLYDTIPLQQIYKIEIIRGPGSALYGANALVGVINIITKKPEDIGGTKVSASGGSFDYKSINALYGAKDIMGFDTVLNANFYRTNGHTVTLEKDSFTVDEGLGNTFGMGFSRLVSPVDQKISLFKSAEKDNLVINTHLDLRQKNGFIGLNEGITSTSNNSEDNSYLGALLNATYTMDNDDYNIKLKGYGHYTDFKETVKVFPIGYVYNSSTYEPGYTRQSIFKGLKYGTDIRGTYHISDKNLVILGANLESQQVLDSYYLQNIDVVSGNETLVENVVPEYQLNHFVVYRNYWALYGENVLDISDTIRLTTGARLDNYSDFGQSFNPRAGIYWEYAKGFDLKVMYGQAFRAPTMQELLIDQANPNLKPETIAMSEVSLGAELDKNTSTRVTYYRSSAKDLIELIANPSNTTLTIRENVGNVDSQGIEWEGKIRFTPESYLKMNYTYQSNMNTSTNATYRFNTPHRANIIFNTPVLPNVNWYTDVNFYNATLDVNETTYFPGGTQVNTAFIWRKMMGSNVDCRLTVRNVFDKKISMPHFIDTALKEIEGPGRSINLMFKVNIKR